MPKPLIRADEAALLLEEAVFLDARAEPGADEAYAEARVRGALRARLDTDLCGQGDPVDGGRHPLPPIERWLTTVGRWGIARSTPVVVYDASGGGMAAARAWWMLRAVGHEPTMVVDGGWEALRAAGAPIESGQTTQPAVSNFDRYPSASRGWPAVDAAFVERVRLDPRWRVLDARAPERYRGDTEPLDPVAGHIPLAKNFYWQSQLDREGRLDARSTLERRYAEALDGVSSEHVVCYCGSGVTACHLLLAMEACGLRDAKLYVGSWSEWCRQGRPRAPG